MTGAFNSFLVFWAVVFFFNTKVNSVKGYSFNDFFILIYMCKDALFFFHILIDSKNYLQII